MAEYILSILRSQLMVVFSWGFHSPARLAGDAGLAFRVNGYKYSGMVEVLYDNSSDTFIVRTLNHDGTAKDTVTDVYIDNLVYIIDHLVETK